MATSFCSCSRRFGAALAVLAASASAWAQTTGALAPVTITAREQAPLFDTTTFTQALETLYLQMLEENGQA